MAMQVVTLQKAQRCSDCGAVLPKGSEARKYVKGDGTEIYYCLSQHVGKNTNQTNRKRVAKPTFSNLAKGKSEAAQLLESILSTLQAIHAELRGLRQALTSETVAHGSANIEREEENYEVAQLLF